MLRTRGGGGIYEQFSNLFVPEAMKEEDIPLELREAVAERVERESGTPSGKLKWYVAAPSGESFFSAVDIQCEEPEGRFLHLALWQDSVDSCPQPAVEVSVPVRFDRPFGGEPRAESEVQAQRQAPGQAQGQAGGQIPTEASGHVQAGGWAWDRRIVSVLGITDKGEKVQVKTVNGCWLLAAPPSEAGSETVWREFRALDRRGNILYSLEF